MNCETESKTCHHDRMGLRTVWRLVTHHAHAERMLLWSQNNDQIAIGWDAGGDLSGFTSAAQISAAVALHLPNNRNKGVSGPQLWKFVHELKVGDLVILSTGKRRGAVMRVSGPYFFAGETDGDDQLYHHRRSAQLTDIDPNVLWRAAGAGDLAPNQSIYWTLVRCGAQVDPTKPLD